MEGVHLVFQAYTVLALLQTTTTLYLVPALSPLTPLTHTPSHTPRTAPPQICFYCFSYIRNEGNKLCPGCRNPYLEGEPRMRDKPLK